MVNQRCPRASAGVARRGGSATALPGRRRYLGAGVMAFELRAGSRSWLLCLGSGSLYAPALLAAPTPVLHMSAPVRKVAVADARLGLA